MAEHTSEQGHWYDREGNPRYKIIGKNGKERPTTLRDAKKEKLLPSVTSIIRCAAAPGLERWKSEQVLMAALTTDRLPNESEQEYIDRIIKDSQEQAMKARERGTLIHAWVQSGFEGTPLETEALTYYESAKSALELACLESPSWICEKAFAEERYGGKVDLHTEEGYIVDIKTTEKDLTNIKTWEEHAMQLAAYSMGVLGTLGACAILYINVLTVESKVIWITESELDKGWRCFSALLDYYYAKTGLGREN
jgi:hypothetical protein